jgi:hypothetical protein
VAGGINHPLNILPVLSPSSNGVARVRAIDSFLTKSMMLVSLTVDIFKLLDEFVALTKVLLIPC